MKVTAANSVGSSVCVNKQIPFIPNENELQNLTGDLSHVCNVFLDKEVASPFTLKKLKLLEDKFRSSPEAIRSNFCDTLWKTCAALALSYKEGKSLNSHPPLQQLQENNPVVFSTREGLGITVEMNETNEGLQVASFCIDPAGCSVNVARALHNLGTPAKLIAVKSNGPVGKIFLELLEKEGIDASNLLDVKQDLCYFLCLLVNGKEHWIVSLSPHLTTGELGTLNEKILDACTQNEKEVLALATRSPVGAQDTYLTEIIKESKDKHGMFVVYDPKLQDILNGFPIQTILESGPNMIKPNLGEFALITGEKEDKLREDRDSIVHLAQELIEKYGIKIFLISLDKDGALLIDKDRVAVAKPPCIKVVSTVGAGDTGIATMINRGKARNYSYDALTNEDFKNLLGAFIAGGCVKTSKPGTESVTLSEVQEMDKHIKVELI